MAAVDRASMFAPGYVVGQVREIMAREVDPQLMWRLVTAYKQGFQHVYRHSSDIDRPAVVGKRRAAEPDGFEHCRYSADAAYNHARLSARPNRLSAAMQLRAGGQSGIVVEAPDRIDIGMVVEEARNDRSR